VTGRQFSAIFQTDLPSLMADSNETKKETVRIAAPLPPAKPPGAGNESRDIAGVDLPTHPPSTVPAPPAGSLDSAKVVNPPRFSPPSLPSPAFSLKPPSASNPMASSSADSLPGPKKETARIAVLPHPRLTALPAVQMKKAPPLVAMPEITLQTAALTVAMKDTSAMVDAIPMPLCWMLLGVSTVILIIQIWTYIS
jgi:hypothetical protein